MTPVDKCTVDHDAIKTSEQWLELEFRGFQKTPRDEHGPAIRHEVRNCLCGSTLYKRLDPAGFCSECAEAAHPSETDDADRCLACIQKKPEPETRQTRRPFGIPYIVCIVALASCAESPSAVDGPDHDFTAAVTLITYQAGVPSSQPIECAPEDHPGLCPLVAFEQRATLIVLEDGRRSLSLWATRDLSSEMPVSLVLEQQPDGCLTDDGASDNTGLRHAFIACPDGDRWVGSVEWTLRAPAGHLRIDMEITP